MTPEQKLKALAYYMYALISKDFAPNRKTFEEFLPIYEDATITNKLNPLTFTEWTF